MYVCGSLKTYFKIILCNTARIGNGNIFSPLLTIQLFPPLQMFCNILLAQMLASGTSDTIYFSLLIRSHNFITFDILDPKNNTGLIT